MRTGRNPAHLQCGISADSLSQSQSCSGCQRSLRSWTTGSCWRWRCRSNAGSGRSMARYQPALRRPLCGGGVALGRAACHSQGPLSQCNWCVRPERSGLWLTGCIEKWVVHTGAFFSSKVDSRRDISVAPLRDSGGQTEWGAQRKSKYSLYRQRKKTPPSVTAAVVVLGLARFKGAIWNKSLLLLFLRKYLCVCKYTYIKHRRWHEHVSGNTVTCAETKSCSPINSVPKMCSRTIFVWITF